MPFYFIVCLEVFRLDVRMLWKPFPTQGSHNTIYIVDNIRDRADPWSTPMLAKKKRNMKLFQLYIVHLLER